MVLVLSGCGLTPVLYQPSFIRWPDIKQLGWARAATLQSMSISVLGSFFVCLKRHNCSRLDYKSLQITSNGNFRVFSVYKHLANLSVGVPFC